MGLGEKKTNFNNSSNRPTRNPGRDNNPRIPLLGYGKEVLPWVPGTLPISKKPNPKNESVELRPSTQRAIARESADFVQNSEAYNFISPLAYFPDKKHAFSGYTPIPESPKPTSPKQQRKGRTR